MHRMYFKLLALKKKQGRNLMEIYLTFTNFSLTPPEKNLSFHIMNKESSF